jgi:NADH:ubiquinone reductase (H+-translocating)
MRTIVVPTRTTTLLSVSSRQKSRHVTARSLTTTSPLLRAAAVDHEDILRAQHSAATTTYPLVEQTGRENVVVLGSGWGGYVFSRRLSPKKYSCTVVSPRSYFVFTPLLTDTAAGNLDFSSIVEPVRSRRAKVDYLQAAARSVDFDRKVVVCEASVVKRGVTQSPRLEEREDAKELTKGPITGGRPCPPRYLKWEEGQVFEVPYDKLVITVGAVSQTFHTPGVRENAMFFKDVGDAHRVKRRVRECFELAVLPTTSEEMQNWLLHFAIVGGGPTGTELAASLRDFILGDMESLYPALKGKPRITVYDVAPRVLSMFDDALSKYAVDTMESQGLIDIKTAHNVEELRWGAPNTEGPHEMDPKGCLTLRTKQEGDVGVGMCVWTTGNAMNPLITHSLTDLDKFPFNSATILGDQKSSPGSVPEDAKWTVKKAFRNGPLLVDGHFRVQLDSRSESGPKRTAILQDVFAIGDNAAPEPGAPPATAQATNQEAKWLAARFNSGAGDRTPAFSFRNMGMLTYLGSAKALMQLPHQTGETGAQQTHLLPEALKGRTAWLVWKVAYLSMNVSWRNRCRIMARWIVNRIFGSDMSSL